ncbi:MAG: AMP-binding protein [Alphaproteobacteria bacterium]|nr:AMP-binding protein [Alphaproteobacteria bacterium]
MAGDLPGTAHRVPPHRAPTAAADGYDGFLGLLAAQASAEPGRLFARFEGEALTLGMLAARSDALASGLRAQGIARGDRVAVMLRNSPAAIVTILALAKCGAIWVPVNVAQLGEGLKYIIGHSDPRLIIAAADLEPVLRDCGAALPPLLLSHGAAGRAGSLESLIATEAAFDEPHPAADDTLAINYTSGTTGPPKGVLVTHRMLRLCGEAVAFVADVADGDIMFQWEPLFHIGGSQMLMIPLLRRARLEMVERFSASRFWDDVAASGATHIHYLGGVIQILLKQDPAPHDRAHRVRIAWGGGCPPDAWRPFEERFGLQIRECYGMTEASSITTCNVEGILGAVGRPVPWFTVALLDPEGRPVQGEAQGEIVVRTSLPGAIFRGYFRNPEATARALRDGALYTGDLGSWGPAGEMRFHGRMTDSMRCRGENVSAWEIEHVAATHPAVADCAVIGVAAEIGEQDIKLFVQPKPGAPLAPASLSAWLGQRLAPYQNPRYIAIVPEFERTPSQRIMKHKLSRSLGDCWDRSAAVTAARR